MPDVLIAGCGYVGRATAKLFQHAGWQVTAWTRSGEIADLDLTIRRFVVDLRERSDVEENSFPCDVVIHCASSRGADAAEYRRIYRDGIANLVACFPQARILFTSSTSVYAQSDGNWVDENSPAEPILEKGKILREAERIVLDSGGIVLRLGGIYGPGRSFFLQSVTNGAASISSAAERFTNQIHRDDSASAIFFLARRPTISPPRIFNVVDNLPASRAEILTWLSARLEMPLSDPARELGRRRGDSNKRVRNDKLRSMGWSPRFPTYQEGLLTALETP